MIDAQEIIEEIYEKKKLMEKWKLDKKTIIGMIHYVKSQFAHTNVYGKYEPEVIDECTDKGIRILEIMDEIFCNPDYDKAEVVTQNVNDKAGWHYIKDGDLPPYHTDILFCNKVGQVFEGFLEQKDTANPYLTDDKKIAFPDYKDGGQWYDFRFRSYHDMDRVIAWTYKPTLTKEEK